MKNVSWKTTITGVIMILSAIFGVILQFINTGAVASEALTGAVGAIIGGFGLITARDDNRTSEDVSADVWSRERENDGGY